MPRTCTICRHAQRLEIERAIVAGTSLRTISGQFGPSKTALLRHRAHVTDTIARSTEARELARTGTLLEDVRAGERRTESLYEAAQGILKNALEDEDPRVAIQAIRAASALMGEARGYLELRGELTNELGRDRTPATMAIQIVCPSAPGGDHRPRVAFAQQAATDAPEEEEGILEIGAIQLGG